jgi:choline dehydrogenase-like flavoprotein
MAWAVTQFSDVHGHRGPGFMLENVAVSPVTTASSLPGFGALHAEAMAELPHLARLVVVLRDRTRGRLELDGGGAARIAYDLAAEDRARLRQAVREAARLYLAAGAIEVWLPVNALAPVRSEADLAALDAAELVPRSLSLLYAVHLFGGAAMSGSRAAGACDESGRVWDARGLYVADASSLPTNTGANPQVTIMANALRIAAGITA